MLVGQTISHYRILALIGAGGMGEVYKAEDTRLKRIVALKFLSAALMHDEEAKRRLIVEAQAASALDHPNICTIHEVDEAPDGRVFLAMAYYEGETLKQRLDRGALPLPEALDIVVQVVRAVTNAHEAGIVHRDIKPANIFLCARAASRASGDSPATTPVATLDEGARVKLLDFGIAKVPGQTGFTRTGSTIGTVAYMAPEHIAGHAIDERADIWSLGVVLYELLAGRLPFAGSNELAMIRAIADGAPAPITAARRDLPAGVTAIVTRALQKEPTDRYPHALDLLQALEAERTLTRTAPVPVRPAGVRQSATSTRRWAAAALLVAGIGVALWLGTRAMRDREADRVAAEIAALVESEQNATALRRLHALPQGIAMHPRIDRLRKESFLSLSVTSDPPGADVAIKGYSEPDAEWIPLGQTPLETVGSIGFYRWRIRKAGFEVFEGTGPPIAAGRASFTLSPVGTTPPEMVYVRTDVPGPTFNAQVPSFFVDRYEVTNQAYKQFVDAGGYRDPKYWQEPFVRDGASVAWDAAVAEFLDATGRPGPSTWELGTYPDGQADWPVRGVSWYEAAAYARFAGKSLPTVPHWRAAAAAGLNSEILDQSNFSGKSPSRVGEYPGIGPFGTFDMAGNVKEWCLNTAGDLRYIMGGAWNEPNYQYRGADARRPFDRSEQNGIRLMSLPNAAEIPPALVGPIEQPARDYDRERPVSDDVFTALARLYAYDKGDLAARTESSSDDHPAWRMERVSYNAAYGNERVVSYVFLPKNAAPPYQTVVYFPHSGGLLLDSFQQAEMAYLGFLVRSGRALLFPMYKGTYERRVQAPATGPNAARDLTIQMIKDVGRSMDYLQTRPDVDANRLAFFGVSMGGNLAPIVLAVERRFATAVVWSGGFPSTRRPPETDPLNFAPRVATPVLMLNGRDDFAFPIRTSQEPMFRVLGTAASDKAHRLYPGGHIFPFSRMIKDSLDWLDRYLGTPTQ
jgi:serine/threonine protein kinase/formylglycine-generating enzyme required for sulfatase activity/dienelactone hydrolase